jgi:hypothetical protein
MDTVAGLIHQLDADIKASRVDESFKTAWRVFVDEWERFYKEHQGWLDRFWYSAYEKTVEYRRRTLAWREKFVALGGKPVGPTDTPPDKPGAQAWRLGQWLLVGGGVALAWKVIDYFGERERRVRSASGSTERALNASLEEAAESRNARGSYYVRIPDTQLYFRVVRDNGGRYVLLVPLTDDARDAIADRQLYAVTMPDGSEGEAFSDERFRYERVSRVPRSVLQ